MEVKIGVSNRHIHLTKKDLELLFGDGYELKVKRYLDQPGQFAAFETVTLKTDKNIKEYVRIVGPTRNYTQVELLEEDKEYFGINPPVRKSGDLDGAEDIIICGPKGCFKFKNVCIIANRHIHINSSEYKNLLEDEIVKVKVGNIILDNVHIKRGNNYSLALHINKDDAKNLNIENGDVGTILEEE